MRRPPAAPPHQAGLLAWAEQVAKYLTTAMERGRVEPTPVLLEHIQPNALAKAPMDGAMMFDPVAKVPVVSINGEWMPLQVGNG